MSNAEATDRARPRRLVSFVGLGSNRADGSKGYERTAYGWEGQRWETEYLAEALCRFFAPQEVFLLATAQARSQHGERLTERLQAAGVVPQFVPLAAGGASADLWREFDALGGALDLVGRDIVLDITHGFRSQPFFCAAAVAFERALGHHTGELRVVYGAFEARGPDGTPVWDLTSFIDLIDWAHGLLLFLRTGLAADVEEMVRDIGQRLLHDWAGDGRQGERPGKVVALSRALGRFGGDLTTLRSLDLLGARDREGSAAELLRLIRSHRDDIEARLPPLARVLDRLEREIEPLTAGTDAGGVGTQGFGSLAQRYLEMGRPLEAAIVVREAWLSRCAPAEATGSQAFRLAVRMAAEQRFRRLHAATHSHVSQLRNDLAHGGFRDNPSSPARLARTVQTLVEELRRQPATQPVPQELSTAAMEPIFLNLSNHPSSGGPGWAAEQLAAAQALAPRLVDLPFPAVPPEASSDEVEQLAEQTLELVPASTVAAMVAGEFTLTARLVAGLQARGIRCVAATTRREAVLRDDGVRESIFRFVQFRTYPNLAGAGEA